MTVRTHDYSMIPGRVDGAQLCGYPIDPVMDRRTELDIRASLQPRCGKRTFDTEAVNTTTS